MKASRRPGQKKAAIFFSDVVGSSRMMQLSTRGTIDFLRLHDHVMETQIRLFKGRVIRAEGDSFLAEFPKKSLALSAALSVMRELEERVGPRKRVRIGLHYGGVAVRGGSVFGEAVDIAKEIESLAPPGAICASMDWADEVPLPDGSSLMSAGKTRLKMPMEPMDLAFIFPTPSARERFERAKAYQQRRGRLRRAVLGLWLAGLALGAWEARPWIADIMDRSRWSLWAQERWDSVDGVYNRWNEKWDQHFVPAGGGSLRLGTAHMIYYRLPFRRQPFTVRLKVRAVEPDREAWAQLSAATTVWPTPKAGPGHDRWDALKWEGIYGALRCSAGTAELSVGYGVKGSENAPKDRVILDLPDPKEQREWVIRFEDSLLSSRLGLKGGAQAWISPWPDATEESSFTFGLSGENIQVDSMRIEHLDREPEPPRQDKESSLFRSAFMGVELAQAILDGALQKPGADAQKLAESAAQGLQAALSFPGGHPARARAEALKLRLLDGALKDGEGALELARQILARRNSPFALEALEIYSRRVLAAGKETQAGAQKFLEEAVKGGRRQCGSAYGSLLFALTEVQRARADVDGYFRSVARLVLDRDFSRFDRNRIYRGLIDGVWDFKFRTQLEAFADHIEKDKAAAWRFYRDVLRAENANMLAPATDFGARSPLLARAMRFFSMTLDFKRLPEGKANAAAPWTYLPALIKSSNYGASPQKPLSLNADGVLVYDFDSGLDGSCGASFRLEDDPSRARDLRAYHGLEVEILAPRGLVWGLLVSESGDGPVGQGVFKGLRGADGEQYYLEQRRGIGAWDRVPFAFSEIRPQPLWGNQDGNNLLDTQAIDRIDIVVPAGQGKGRILVRRIRFIP